MRGCHDCLGCTLELTVLVSLRRNVWQHCTIIVLKLPLNFNQAGFQVDMAACMPDAVWFSKEIGKALIVVLKHSDSEPPLKRSK